MGQDGNPNPGITRVFQVKNHRSNRRTDGLETVEWIDDVAFPVRVSKVFEDEVCLQIMDDANRGEISVPAFYAKYGKRFGLSKSMIRSRFAKLVQYGWLKVVGYRSGGKRRGGTEKFYGATGPALYDEDKRGPWANVPDYLAETDDWKTFGQLGKWVKATTTAGTPSPATMRPAWLGRFFISTRTGGKEWWRA